MRISPLPAQALGLALLLTLSATAQAAERFYMPYDCSFDGARVRMRPSFEDRAYTIIGPRERQIFSSCAPDDPTSCRSWFVHRFDFQCDGGRVSWLEAAGAAAHGKNWDAWVADGRFSMRMGRDWGVAAARPLFRHRWRRDRFDEFDRDPFGPGGFRDQTSIVTLPQGFAPAMGIALSFSGGDEPMAQAPAPYPGVAGDGYARAPATEPYLQREFPEEGTTPAGTSPFETTTTVEAPLQPPPAAAQPVPPEPTVTAPPAPATPVPAPPAAATTAAAGPEPSSSTTAAANVPRPVPAAPDAARSQSVPARPGDAPTIINEHGIAGPAPEVAQQPAKLAAAGSNEAQPNDSAAAAPEGAGAVAAGDGIAQKLEGADVPASPSAWDTGTTVVPDADGGGVLVEYTVAVALSAAVLALAGLAAFGFWRRRGVPAEEPPLRDIADISFDSAPRANARALSLPGPAAAAAPARPAKSEALEELLMPTDYDEALEVLGANPDALLGDIKKIVDGLRRNWHPDHATSEADRQQRERRLQQINVAWDLISKQRSAA